MPDAWIHRLQKMQPLACILGNGGEVFFPKLGVAQILTLSSIFDKFVAAEGFEKKACGSDAEVKQYASSIGYDSGTYPVVYFASDTTGEKAYVSIR